MSRQEKATSERNQIKQKRKVGIRQAIKSELSAKELLAQVTARRSSAHTRLAIVGVKHIY